ncbi:flagellar protein FlaG [Paenibacillus shunpengii]|uniref:Flagellar protein FlaG n=1 Tax=Paenibacillus shunpengii TaxID=2054424 RepID=A0ABW5SVT6_9BACL
MNLQSSSISINAVSNKTVELGQQDSLVTLNQKPARIITARSTADINILKKTGVQIPIGEEKLILAIEKAAKILAGPTTTLDISVHEKTHQIMVKVLNKEDGSLIREIPPEKTLDLVAKMMEIAGIIIDEKA